MKTFSLGFSIDDGENSFSIDATYRYSFVGDHLLPAVISYCNATDSMKIAWDSSKRKYNCHFEAPSLKKEQDDESTREIYEFLSKMLEKKNRGKKGRKGIGSTNFFEAFFSKTYSHEDILPGGISPRELSEQISGLPLGIQLMVSLRSLMEAARSHMGYVGPIRAMPLRHYLPEQPPLSVDPQGAHCAQLLADWRTHSKKKFKQVTEILSELELVKIVKPRSSADEILKILVQPFPRSELSNFADVGFGVSQVLPVIVTDLALPAYSILFLNQPEVHLHPTSQAKLADYFVSRSKQRQFIVETHSEYIINRLRVLTMKGKLDPKDVSIVFLASTQSGGLQQHMISLNADGSLNNAPPEFFQTYYLDSFELAMGGAADGECH